MKNLEKRVIIDCWRSGKCGAQWHFLYEDLMYENSAVCTKCLKNIGLILTNIELFTYRF